MDVGIRELRNHLSDYLDKVQAGDEVVVTDRGAAVAKIVPVTGRSTLDRLIAEGLVSPAPVRTRTTPPKPVVASGIVSDLVVEQRR
jgi:prevent-host-death family protein